MLKVYLAGKVGGPKWKVMEGRTNVKCCASDGGDHSEHNWGIGHLDFDRCNDDYKKSLRDNFLTQLRECDILLAFLDTPDSYGSVAEIATASAWGIPTHVIVATPASNVCSTDPYGDYLWKRPSWEKIRQQMYETGLALFDAYWFACSLPNVTVYTPDTWKGVQDTVNSIIEHAKEKDGKQPYEKEN